MNKKKLKIARKKVDQLDKKIFNLIKRRTKIVRYMLSLKQFKNQIVDQKRSNVILKNIRKKSVQHGVDPKVTSRIWKTMIWSFIDYQRRNFKKK
jgi:chorismate mutase|tara:strand:+ start:50 stop:331 length:282 start_codon:yes stop_codon:yes gene_type:complete